MIQTHINTNNTDFTYQNTTEVGQNIFFTGTGGAGNINTSTYDSGNTRYFHAGSAGVSLQIFINDSLVESISGGSGNIQSIADVKKHVRTENHRSSYSCGFLGLKRCWRDNWVQIWEWGHNRRNATHRAEGQTKSFVLNIPPQSSLKVKFIGSSDSEFKGSVSISLLENTQSIPLKPIDLSGLEGIVEPETPEVQEQENTQPQPEVPEVDSSENTEQGGDNSQENTESENTESENPPITEPETEQEQEPTISAEMREEARKLTEAMQSYQTFLRENKETIVAFGNMGDVSYQLAIKKKYSLPLSVFCDSKFLVDLPYVELWYGLPPVSGKFEQDMLDCGLIPHYELTFANELKNLTYPQLLEIVNSSGESEPSPEVQEPTPQFPPVTIEQVNNFINFVGELNTFWNANESLEIREGLTFGDFYANTRSGLPMLQSYPYADFIKKYWVLDSINTWIDSFMSSKTPEIVEFFKANPKPETRYYNTEYNEVMDLYEFSRQDLTYLLQKLETEA